MDKIYKAFIFFFSLLLILAFGNAKIKQQETSGTISTPPKIGELAPDINLPSTDRNKSYKLSDLRGKLVLVNFWASMNAPCSYENRNQVKVYNRFKGKSFTNAQGFEIFSVSLDSNLDNWKKAIQKDQLNWPYQVSDLKGRGSDVAIAYGVTSIPYNYLIDGDGKVLAINLRGPQLSSTIENYIK